MKKIRTRCFETNSSSCHSLSIAAGTTNFTSITPDHDGIVRVRGGEFGWGPETYHDAESKLAYCLQYIADWTDCKYDPNNERLKIFGSVRDLILADWTPSYTANEKSVTFLKVLDEVVAEQTGGTGCDLLLNGDFYPYGYIDHQSVESSDLDYLFEDKDALRRFIFSTDSLLTIDNDNH